MRIRGHRFFHNGFAEVGGIGKLDSVVRQDGMDCIRHGFDKGMQEVCSNATGGAVMQLGVCELRCAVDGNEYTPCLRAIFFPVT